MPQLVELPHLPDTDIEGECEENDFEGDKWQEGIFDIHRPRWAAHPFGGGIDLDVLYVYDDNLPQSDSNLGQE